MEIKKYQITHSVIQYWSIFIKEDEKSFFPRLAVSTCQDDGGQNGDIESCKLYEGENSL